MVLPDYYLRNRLSDLPTSAKQIDVSRHQAVVNIKDPEKNNVVSCIPEQWRANTKHSPNAGTLLVHRLRRWPNSVPTLGECLVFAVWCVSLLYILRCEVIIAYFERAAFKQFR